MRRSKHLHAARTSCRSSEPSGGRLVMTCSKIRNWRKQGQPRESTKCIQLKRTNSVKRTGQKLVKLCLDRRHSRTRTQRKTSLCTTGATTLRRISTNFSWMTGSWVKKWFFSPVKIIKDNLRTFEERRSISYSLLVKMLADGAVATLAIHAKETFWARNRK